MNFHSSSFSCHFIYIFICHEFSFTGLIRSEVQSARQLKKVNSKSKHNALLFTAAKTRVC